MPPANFARQRFQRVDDRPQKGRLALAVVPDDGRPGAVLDLDADPRGDLPFGIADRQVDTPERRPAARFDLRRRGC